MLVPSESVPNHVEKENNKILEVAKPTEKKYAGRFEKKTWSNVDN